MIIFIQIYLLSTLGVTALFALFKLGFCFTDGDFLPRNFCDRHELVIFREVLQINILQIYCKVFGFLPKLVFLNLYLLFGLMFIR
jgi:hypothetical protein